MVYCSTFSFCLDCLIKVSSGCLSLYRLHSLYQFRISSGEWYHFIVNVLNCVCSFAVHVLSHYLLWWVLEMESWWKRVNQELSLRLVVYNWYLAHYSHLNCIICRFLHYWGNLSKIRWFIEIWSEHEEFSNNWMREIHQLKLFKMGFV